MSSDEEEYYEVSSASDDDDDDFRPNKNSITNDASASSSLSIKRQTPSTTRTKQMPLTFNNGAATPEGRTATPLSTSKPVGTGSKKKAIEDIYQRKSQLEHILLRPDTYIGSVEPTSAPMWVIDDAKMAFRPVTFVPGLYKIFDEILIRDPTMDTIKVWIKKDENLISIMNNGKGIPVTIHTKEQVYVPELIFGHLLTSSNYDDDERKVTGGRNGYGAKLCNIFSKEFVVETSDKESGHKFRQTFNENMSKKSSPKITKAAVNDFTKITFKPDLEKFGMDAFDDDLVALLTKRVYDIAGVARNVKVYLNDERVKIRNFKEYVKLYLDSTFGDSGNRHSIVYEQAHDRWEIAFAVSDGQFQQVSFVNSICTSKGGTHVNAIADQLVSKINEFVKKKNKGTTLKPHQIKSHMWLFVNCLIENPSFDSQTKENMTLKQSKFGSKCTIGEEFIKKVLRSGVVDNILAFAKVKQAQQLKTTDGAKRARLSGIAKLDDANNAGTKNAKQCTLILTEGDSAKALAISGLSVVGRDNFGVFPLRGKLLNVREASHKQIMENQEIGNIKQILGLKSDKSYTSTDSLRYGKVMIMADQDHDGSHIKGLLVNLFDYFWPSLLKSSGFLLQFITPIVRVTKGTQEINFFNIPEYENWRRHHNDGKGWNIKYYKGLGTSTAADAKKYFSAMETHLRRFAKADDGDRQAIELAFSKKRADERKDWLANLAANTYLDHTTPEIPISDFVNKELILFSMADNVRSIPSLVDGFKPGQRKIIYACIKRNLIKGEVKVAQLAGYVSEHSAYHHGEASLQSTMINLAQDFVGSNNLNLLEPRGQFGTRLQGGKDHAHARYIFTRLSSATRMIYHPQDDKLLKYLNEENMDIEPEWYVPIIPMVLVNGAEGIGTGWSTTIPNFNPRDIIENLKRRLDEQAFQRMHPWYRGFKGSVELQGDKYKITGLMRQLDETTLEVTELPIGSWTQAYKEFLESLLTGTDKTPPSIRDYKEYHTDTAVHFVIYLTEDQMREAKEEGLEKKFRLATTKSINNMVLFDSDGHLKRYASVEDIMEEFFDLRMKLYHARKNLLAQVLRKDLTRLQNQVRFVLEVINGDLIVHNRTRANVVQQLEDGGFASIPKKQETSVDFDVDDADDSGRQDYDYLLSMPIWNLTMEKVQKLTDDCNRKQEELDELLATSPSDLWRKDLSALEDEWNRLEAAFDERYLTTTTKGTKGQSVRVPAANPKKRKSLKSIDVDQSDAANDHARPAKRKSAAGATHQKEGWSISFDASSMAEPHSGRRSSAAKQTTVKQRNAASPEALSQRGSSGNLNQSSEVPDDPFAFDGTESPKSTKGTPARRGQAKLTDLFQFALPKQLGEESVYTHENGIRNSEQEQANSSHSHPTQDKTTRPKRPALRSRAESTYKVTKLDHNESASEGDPAEEREPSSSPSRIRELDASVQEAKSVAVVDNYSDCSSTREVRSRVRRMTSMKQRSVFDFAEENPDRTNYRQRKRAISDSDDEYVLSD
ncbi:DNA topoisomerase 2 [Gaertneriomyces sp. JEL0708]|nr:DNA topoisomerase 2 [Gaertneriomyces sp. JEL0708]